MHQAGDNPQSRAIEVQRGDSVYDISRRYSVNQRALIETNNLSPPYSLSPGAVIYLPPPNVHVVQSGETLYSVSRRYNVDTRSLALMNGLARPWTVWPGDELLLPPLARDQGRTTAVASSAPSPTPQASRATPPAAAPARATVPPTPVSESTPIRLTPVAGPHAVGAPPAGGFIWPAAGALLSGFGVADGGVRNDGVDIGAPAGAEVKSAAAGEVVYAGDELSGFGNLLLVQHPGGWVSAYAQASELLVRVGERVRQGQAVARAGPGGRVHFELRLGRDPVDPALYLPPR